MGLGSLKSASDDQAGEELRTVLPWHERAEREPVLGRQRICVVESPFLSMLRPVGNYT